MRRAILALTLASAGLAFGYGSASAQVVYKPDADGMLVAAPEGGPKPIGPRVYGYYQADPDLARPQGPGGCGTYFFWNGERCVDARTKSPAN